MTGFLDSPVGDIIDNVCVIALAAGQNVPAFSAIKGVVAVTAKKAVVTGTAPQKIIALEAKKTVRNSGRNQLVSVPGARNRRHDAHHPTQTARAARGTLPGSPRIL